MSEFEPVNEPEPTPEQLVEFAERVHGLMGQAKSVRYHDASRGTYFVNRYGWTTTIGIGRGLLFSEDTVDVMITSLISEDNQTGLRVFNDESYAYSPSLGITYFKEERIGIIGRRKLRSEFDQRFIDLTSGNENETLALLMDDEALDTAEGPLADVLRETRELEAARRQILTRDRMDRVLEELRYLRPEHEDRQLSASEVEEMIPGLFADMIEDEHMTGKDEDLPDNQEI